MSTTTNLKLFKHDNPTTNTNQFDVEKALNENWDKVDKNAGEVANKIQALEIATNKKDTSQDEEIQVLKAENTLLKSQIPSATVVGETIHLEDSSNMQCQISPIGASKQETREGYNLLDTSKFEETTSEGVILTRNEDGTIVLNGTATGSVLFRILRTGSNIVATGDEIITINQLGGTISGGNLKLSCQTTDYTDLVYSQIGTANVTNKLKADVTYNIFTILIDEGTICTNLKLGLVISSSETEYEQYGASPSIEYEAPIESVGDNINLFNIETVTVNTYINHETGKTATSGSSITSDYIEIKANESITIVYDYETLQNTSNRGIAFYNENKTFLSGTTYTSTKKETTIIPNQNGYMRFCYDNNCTNVKVVKGTKATTYSPYGQGSIEIYNCNQNLFNKNDSIVENSYFTANGEIGTDSGTFYQESYIKVTPNTEYSISSLETDYFRICEYAEDKTFIIRQIRNSTGKSFTFTTSSTTEYIRISCYEKNLNSIKLEKGSTATQLVEHQSQTKSLYTQQPFRAIGDEKDRFVKQNGLWYEEHNVERIVFDGTQEFSAGTFGINTYQYYKLGISPISDRKILTSSNYFKGVTIADRASTDNYLVYLAQNYIYFRNTEFATVDKLKAKLTELYHSGTPLYVDYVLATPTLIPCTPEQVEVLESFNTYKNVTNISSDSIGEIEVTYSKDLETLYNNLSQAVLGGN